MSLYFYHKDIDLLFPSNNSRSLGNNRRSLGNTRISTYHFLVTTHSRVTVNHSIVQEGENTGMVQFDDSRNRVELALCAGITCGVSGKNQCEAIWNNYEAECQGDLSSNRFHSYYLIVHALRAHLSLPSPHTSHSRGEENLLCIALILCREWPRQHSNAGEHQLATTVILIYTQSLAPRGENINWIKL